MGVNISQFKISKIEGEFGDYDLQETDFDFIRYWGDRIVAEAEGLECEYLNLGGVGRDAHTFWRPKNVDAAIEWCNKELPSDASKKRWITEFEKMRTDSTLYFYNGW